MIDEGATVSVGSSRGGRSSPLVPQEVDFPRWYQEIVALSELAENGPARGTMVIRPYGYSLWERVQSEIDARIKVAGATNAYFPLLIPQQFLEREADHVEGFSPEFAAVTHAGGKDLETPLIVRPTSETIIGDCMSRWIHSHRDLPLLLNQWANVVRWEMRPRLFLRTSEFLWQEGHTAHATEADATAYARRIHLEVYRDFFENVLALPVHVGHKTARERFSGAVNTLTCEAVMGDGKALQVATSHELGQNFAKAFDIGFTDESGSRKPVWTTSWGSSTRIIGGLIMGHGDNRGLKIPPRLAPVQVVILPVRETAEVMEAAQRLRDELAASGVRVVADIKEGRFGRKVVNWELKGVPLRVELGPRELEAGHVTLVRRDQESKAMVPLAGLAATVTSVLESVHVDMATAARERLVRLTPDVDSIEAAIEAGAQGLARLPWSLVRDGGEDLLAEHAMTVRCLQTEDGSLPGSGDAQLHAIVGRSY